MGSTFSYTVIIKPFIGMSQRCRVLHSKTSNEIILEWPYNKTLHLAKKALTLEAVSIQQLTQLLKIILVESNQYFMSKLLKIKKIIRP